MCSARGTPLTTRDPEPLTGVPVAKGAASPQRAPHPLAHAPPLAECPRSPDSSAAPSEVGAPLRTPGRALPLSCTPQAGPAQPTSAPSCGSLCSGPRDGTPPHLISALWGLPFDESGETWRSRSRIHSHNSLKCTCYQLRTGSGRRVLKDKGHYKHVPFSLLPAPSAGRLPSLAEERNTER